MSSTLTTMEQQQNELFALIGEVTYRLRLVEAENEKLKDENRTTTEKLQDMTRHYNETFAENEQLKKKLQEIEEERKAAETAMGFGRPMRQFGHDEPPFEADESTIFPSLNDAQIDGFYGEDHFRECQWCREPHPEYDLSLQRY